MPLHRDGCSRISLVVAGQVREWTARSEVLGEPTSVVIKPAGIAHSNLFGPDGACMVSLEWSPELDETAGLQALHEQLVWHDHGPVNKAVLALFSSTAWLAAQPSAVENLFFEFLACLDGPMPRLPAGTPPAWLVRAQAHLDDTFEQPYSVRALAREAGVHPVHFSRTFRHYAGCTVSDYVRRRRVRAMASGLIYTGRRAWHLALDTGFADGAHASRSFRKELGLTPSAYRRIFFAAC